MTRGTGLEVVYSALWLEDLQDRTDGFVSGESLTR